MRTAKSIAFLVFLISAGSYFVVNKNYRSIEKQLASQQKINYRLSQVKDDLLSGIKKSFSNLINNNSAYRDTDLKDRMSRFDSWLTILRCILIASAFIILLVSFFSETASPFIIFICSLLLLLLAVTTPFLQIVVKMPLLGSSEDIIIYHKTKSITGVVFSLFKTGRPYEMVLAILVGVFSVIFPLVKFVLPIFPHSVFTAKVHDFLYRFSTVDLLVAAIIVSLLATDQIIGSQTADNLFLTGKSKLDDGVLFFLSYLGFAALYHRKVKS